MKRRLYVAYGSNLNLEQMKYRCPTAKLVGTGVINDYELQFKGFPTGAFATIGQRKGASVPVGVFEIQPMDERSLDRYEGYPSHYFKKTVPVALTNGDKVNAMVYIMNPKMKFGMPSTNYYCVVHQGYKDCGLDTQVLNEALQKSAAAYYEHALQSHTYQLRLRVPELEVDDEEPDEDDAFDEEPAEDDAFDYEEEELDEEDFEDEEGLDYSGGMQL